MSFHYYGMHKIYKPNNLLIIHSSIKMRRNLGATKIFPFLFLNKFNDINLSKINKVQSPTHTHTHTHTKNNNPQEHDIEI